jgi:hypothetical protein
LRYETLSPVHVTASSDRKKSHPAAPFHLMFHAEPRDEAKARERLAALGLIPPQ